MSALPQKYRILPYSVPFRVPGFGCHYCDGIETLAPVAVRTEDWFHGFVARIDASIGKRYLPVCRISDGEFRFLLGDQPLTSISPLHDRIRAWLRIAARSMFRANGFTAGGRSGERWLYDSGRYTRREWRLARQSYSESLVSLIKSGVLAVHLTHGTPQPFQEHYFKPFGAWLDSQCLELTLENYVPFYFVYALLRGAERARILKGRRILVIHGATGEKRDQIARSLHLEGVESVRWITISRDRSFYDTIDVSQYTGSVDLCLVGAGVGKPRILVQLHRLSIPCIDAGFVFEVWACADNARKRAYMIPDSHPESDARLYLDAIERERWK